MEGGGIFRNSQIVVLGVCIVVATIAGSVILSGGILKVTKFMREQISVTGSAQKTIKSDYTIWRSSFSRTDADMKVAYASLKTDLDSVKKYLASKGIKDNEIYMMPAAAMTLYRREPGGMESHEVEGYRISQSVEVRSNDVEKITRVSQEATELIAQGLLLESQPPEYFYTKLDELKVEMLAKATENAKARAGNMVRATGNRIGMIRSAKMGVFQITPASSTDVSNWGVNDTSSLDKKVTAVVTVSFAID